MTREHYTSCDDVDDNGHRISPEKALLWGFLQRAIEDLGLRRPELLGEVRSAVSWFRGNELTAFTFVTIVEELELSNGLLKRISEKVDEAEVYTEAKAKEEYDKWKSEGKKGGTGMRPFSARTWSPKRQAYSAVRGNWGDLRRIG